MPIWRWAEKRRKLSADVTARPGPYRIRLTPFMREPQESFLDPEVQTTVLCCASRTGKTETEMNLTGYTIDHDPAPMLWVYPTLDGAKKWRKEFLTPMLAASPCFTDKVRPIRSRDAENTMLSIRFRGGRLSAIGTNAPSAFRQIQAPRVVCEEIDAMENGPEGDPIALAFKRADNYPDSIQIVSSTPTVKGRSRIWGWLEASDFRKWFCPCVKCHHAQVWAWRQLKWEEGKEEQGVLVCERCGWEHDDAARRASVAAGEWRMTQAFRGIRGYWLNGINSLFSQKKGFRNLIHQMIAEFRHAKAEGRETLRVWTNTFLCETFDEDPGIETAPEELAKRGEDYAPDHLPAGVLLLTAAADVQVDRIEALVAGWGKDEEFWAVEKKTIEGDPEGDEVWEKLDAHLAQRFTREDGLELGVERALIDMGYKNKRVLSFCAPRIVRGIYPCRGINRVGLQVPPLLPAQPSRNNRARIPHWNIGVTVAKTALFDRLMLPTPGPRSMHFPQGCGFDVEHFRQMLAEKRKTRYSYGQRYFIFEKENAAARNEALDLHVYALAALESLGRIAWGKRAEYLATLIPAKPGDSSGATGLPSGPATPPPARVQIPRRPWATSW